MNSLAEQIGIVAYSMTVFQNVHQYLYSGIGKWKIASALKILLSEQRSDNVSDCKQGKMLVRIIGKFHLVFYPSLVYTCSMAYVCGNERIWSIWEETGLEELKGSKINEWVQKQSWEARWKQRIKK